MTLTRFRNGFWYGFAAGVLLALLPALLSAPKSAPKPPFPVPGKEFVAEYGGQAAYIAHLAYRWGLFGIGARIRDADIVLLGSSHMQFGLSARQLSETLSRQAGRPIRVFNAGLGCDTPLGYDGALLDRLRLGDRLIIVDAFANDFDPYNAPCFAELAGMTDAVHAGAKALTVWTRFAWDWALDGVLPRIDLRGGRVKLTRYLNAPATILDWNYGDAAYLYRPDRGEEFPAPPPDRPQDLTQEQESWRLAGGTLPLLPAFASAMARGARPVFTLIPFVRTPAFDRGEEFPAPPPDRPQDLTQEQESWRLAGGTLPLLPAFASAVSRSARPVFTLIPFVRTPAFDRDRYDNVAHLLGTSDAGPRAPFLALAPQGLASFDGEHLTGDSRAVATARLAAALAEAKLVPPAPAPGGQ